jgi:hypothetical protein
MTTIRSSEDRTHHDDRPTARAEALAWVASAWQSELVLAALQRRADTGRAAH